MKVVEEYCNNGNDNNNKLNANSNNDDHDNSDKKVAVSNRCWLLKQIFVSQMLQVVNLSTH